MFFKKICTLTPPPDNLYLTRRFYMHTWSNVTIYSYMNLLIAIFVNKREVHCVHKLPICTPSLSLCDTCTCVNLKTLKTVDTVSNFLGYLR